jgi:hypothetical protein
MGASLTSCSDPSAAPVAPSAIRITTNSAPLQANEQSFARRLQLESITERGAPGTPSEGGRTAGNNMAKPSSSGGSYGFDEI